MKHDPDLYNDVVSRFFTDDMIKHIEDMRETKRPADSAINLTPEIELIARMHDFAIQYNGLEVKQHYTQEEIEKIATINTILNNKRAKITIEIAIKGLENLSPEFKKQFPGYKSSLERYKRMLRDLDN